MMKYQIKQKTYLTFAVLGRKYNVELITKDIGATIGTEILDDYGNRLVAYRPGTRYASRAEELAAKHLEQALEHIARVGELYGPLYPLLEEYLPKIVVNDSCTLWDPDQDDVDWDDYDAW